MVTSYQEEAEHRDIRVPLSKINNNGKMTKFEILYPNEFSNSNRIGSVMAQLEITGYHIIYIEETIVIVIRVGSSSLTFLKWKRVGGSFDIIG